MYARHQIWSMLLSTSVDDFILYSLVLAPSERILIEVVLAMNDVPLCNDDMILWAGAQAAYFYPRA